MTRTTKIEVFETLEDTCFDAAYEATKGNIVRNTVGQNQFVPQLNDYVFAGSTTVKDSLFNDMQQHATSPNGLLFQATTESSDVVGIFSGPVSDEGTMDFRYFLSSPSSTGNSIGMFRVNWEQVAAELAPYGVKRARILAYSEEIKRFGMISGFLDQGIIDVEGLKFHCLHSPWGWDN